MPTDPKTTILNIYDLAILYGEVDDSEAYYICVIYLSTRKVVLGYAEGCMDSS